MDIHSNPVSPVPTRKAPPVPPRDGSNSSRRSPSPVGSPRSARPRAGVETFVEDAAKHSRLGGSKAVQKEVDMKRLTHLQNDFDEVHTI